VLAGPPGWRPGASESTSAPHRVGSLLGAQRQAPEVEAEASPSLAQEPEVDEPAEAPLSLLQPLEVGPSAPEPMPAGGPGALRTNWSGLHTSLRQVPPEGDRPVPAPPELRSTPSTGELWPRSAEGDSWPWPARGHAPGFT